MKLPSRSRALIPPFRLLLILIGVMAAKPETMALRSPVVTRQSVFGPKRSSPDVPLPTHAYAPFDKLDTPPPYQPAPGRDYRDGDLVIKFAPDVVVHKNSGAGLAGPRYGVALTGQDGLNRVLAAQGITQLDTVFPNASPPVQTMSARNRTALPDLTRWFRARTTGASADAVEALTGQPGIEVVEPDYVRKLADGPVAPFLAAAGAASDASATPGGRGVGLMGGGGSIPGPGSDPLYAQQWHLAATKAPEAWAFLESQGLPPGGNRDIVVAVIDTGVDYTHPDLAANIWTNSREIAGNGRDDDGNGFVDDVHGCTTVGNSSSHSGNPMDDHGHGTHVAGIIAAQAGNQEGGVGVAYNVQIMAIKAAQYSGTLAASDVAEAIQYAVAQGADIINMSFGGYAKSQVEEDALAVAFGQCVLVAAAGNDGAPNEPCDSPRKPTPMYPAAYNWVLGVMARTQDPDGEGNYLASFSNFEGVPNTTTEYELMAPGADVWSTLPNGQYAAWDGTSMATPLVSGLAALARTRWTDKDLYSSRFIMGQLATTGASLQGRTDDQGEPVAFYHTGDALAALTTVPQPQLSYLQHWLFDTTQQAAHNDNDGIVDASETVDLAIVIRNYWGKAEQVSVKLEAWAPGAVQADPYVQWIADTVDYGAIGSFSWDDNGLIYEAQGVITGVRHPFRFTVSADCPNDHVIPLRLSMSCRNGLDPADSTVYTAQSRFQLLVQRGRELPRIISADMTLTKDNLWLVPDRVLVESGATLRVTEGTQIQFWSADPSSPYSGQLRALLQVEGRLFMEGSVDEPVEVFPGQAYPGYGVEFTVAGNGVAELRYARVVNPALGTYGAPLTLIDHCEFLQDTPGWLRGSSSPFPSLQADLLTGSRLRTVGRDPTFLLHLQLPVEQCLLDSCATRIYTRSARGNVFLRNRNEAVSTAVNAGYLLSATNSARAVFPELRDGKTYFAVSGKTGFDGAEAFAQYLGGHLAAINDADENSYVYTYLQNLQNRVTAQYPTLDPTGFMGRGIVGLTRESPDGPFVWTSGEPVVFTNWASGSPVARWPANNPRACRVLDFGGGAWEDFVLDQDNPRSPYLLEVPGSWSQAALDAASQEFLSRSAFGTFRNNAILNDWWDPDPAHWLCFRVIDNELSWYYRGRDTRILISENYWATTSPTLIERAIWDYQDDFNVARYVWEPALTEPPVDCYPFVTGVNLSTEAGTNLTVVGAEPVTLAVTFNRDMDTNTPPQVSFGPDTPMTDYTVHPVGGGWQDPRTWIGTFNITPTTGDGYQLIRVARAVAADDPWLVTGDDAGRFRFEIITSGTESMNLQATGGEGRVDLSWMQDDFDLLAGYNLYRSTHPSNNFTRLNPIIIPPLQKTYRDTQVQPGQPYYYKFTVVKTDMGESGFSNTDTGTPLDTIPPVVSHTPITSAAPGLPLTLFAEVTDNVAVQGVTLFFRKTGEAGYANRSMTRTTGNRYAATIEGSRLVSPGLDYYVEATDGVSVTRSGRADLPWPVAVDDRPVVTTVSPVRGPAGGGTAVTIAGSNFKPGARVRFGEMPAGNVVVLSSSQLTCVTPTHYPAVVDVTVSDEGGASGVLLRGYTYDSDVVSLGLPHTGGGRNALVEVPVTLANVEGLVHAAFTARFDPAVLRPAAGRTGSLAPGWSVAVNTGISGQLRVAMASPGGAVSGSGVLAVLTFEVVGAPGSSSVLGIDAVSLNDGVIPVETAAGSFAVNVVYDVRGRVAFWNQNRPVPGVELFLRGDRVFAGSSGSDGAYVVGGADAGAYTLVPAKGDLAYGISAYDAALVLEHDAGLANLNGHAAHAGDVNKSGGVNGMDAFYLLQRVVGLIELPFPGAGVVWEFDPANRSIQSLSANLTGQDFTAILLGDVSGNWGPAGPVSGIGLHGPGPAAAVLSLRTQETDEGGRRHWLVARIPEPGLRSLELTLTSDTAAHRVSVVESGELLRGWLLAANATEGGQARLALAGATPVNGVGALATFMAPVESGPWRIESATADEGVVRIEVDPTGRSFEVDSDGDGHSDWQEILAGTDPASAAGVLRLMKVEFENATTLRLRWPSVAGRRYQVETRSTLTKGDWTAVGPVVLGAESSGETGAVVAVSGGEGYYRVRLVE